MRHLGLVLVLVLLGLAACASGGAPGATGQPRPPEGCQERRVVVGSFGDSEWSQHFGRALAGRLRERGFAVVTDPAGADLAVSGQVTMDAYRTVPIWRGDVRGRLDEGAPAGRLRRGTARAGARVATPVRVGPAQATGRLRARCGRPDRRGVQAALASVGRGK